MIVFTAVFGRTDPLHEPAFVGRGIQYLCFTDQEIESEAWTVKRVPRQDDPARASRIFKANPGFSAPSLWIDANFTLLVDPREILEAHPEPWVTFRHRDRTRITQEAAEIIRLRKCDPMLVTWQLESYRGDGFDTDAAPMRELSCNGMMLRRPTDQVAAVSEMLANELASFSSRDQMALDYCAWKHRLPLGRFPGTFDSNPYTRYTHCK